MGITESITINELLSKYPYLQDYLIRRSPKFKKLSNPVIRSTMGKIATVTQAATIGGIDPKQLVDELNEEIRRKGGAAMAEADADRRAQLKQILLDLHAGAERAALKERFRQFLYHVSPTEIAEIEQSLIDGGLPQSEIKNLSSLHLEIFRETLNENALPELPSGHPVASFVSENREATGRLEALRRIVELAGTDPSPAIFTPFAERFGAMIEDLAQIEKHYLRKENQLFPFLEKRGFSGPAQVMWALHDDIRAQLKIARNPEATPAERIGAAAALVSDIGDMIQKEELILLPMALELLTEDDWRAIRHGERDIGYAWITPGSDWPEVENDAPATLSEAAGAAGIPLDCGVLSGEMLNLMLTHLPVDLTLVGADDRVLYFSQGRERIFPRSPGIIGREVRNCHPPKSVHIVEEILNKFRSGERDEAEF
ncbi:MAG TPA: DUF438 domain-containing protein, partial [Desulfuromonadales bacterium]|nr:DUF438 domain-containing protein [Desulfuromonadales bacterium]